MSMQRSFVVAVAVVLIHEDRVLALRRAASKDVGAGVWETVAGRLEGEESLEEAAHREVLEETGLPLANLTGPIDAYRMMRGDRDMVVVVYTGALIGEGREPSIARSAEHDAHAWLTLEEAERDMPPRLAQALRRAVQ
jgi:8-oxo-dGTP pyrophosphatase MutT (NUDIX family)